MLYQLKLSRFALDALPLAAKAILSVVAIVTLLAECREIQKVASLWSVIIYVRGREHYLTSSNRVRLTVNASTPFAVVASAIKAHEATPKFPVLRIPCFVFWAYWHDITSQWSAKSIGAINPTRRNKLAESTKAI